MKALFRGFSTTGIFKICDVNQNVIMDALKGPIL